MFVRKIMTFNTSDTVHRCKIKITAIGKFQNFLSLSRRKELPSLIEKFKCVPLSRIVTGGDDYSSVGTGKPDCKFRCRRRGKTAFDNVHATRHKRAAHKLLHHLTADTGVTSYDHAISLAVRRYGNTSFQTCTIGISKLNDIHRRQTLSTRAAYSATNSGYRFN